MKKKDKRQPISASQAMKRMKALCESTGIPFRQNQPPEGSASVRFMRKSKKNLTADEAIKSMQEFLKKNGLKEARSDQPREGTASIHFMNKPKKGNK